MIHDLGQALGCGAVMTALQRTCAMGVALADCVTLEQLQALRDSGGDFAPVCDRWTNYWQRIRPCR